MKIALPNVFAFVDTETTGLSPIRDRVIEIGIIRVEGGREVARLDTLLNPHVPVPPSINGLTGISNEDLLHAPDFNEIEHQVREILEGSVFVAHNARFDYAFLKHEFKRSQCEFGAKVMCTVKLARRLYPALPSYRLSSLIEHFSLPVAARHRALADAEVLWQLLKMAVSDHGEDEVARTIKSLLRAPSTPSNLPPEAIDSLPESPGIYIFYGEDDENTKSSLPLYVGKSINIKERVKSHFSGDYLSGKDLAISSQIKRIEATKTVGEIGALVRECDAVKALMPVYNRQLRRRSDLVVATKAKRGGVWSIKISTLHDIATRRLSSVMAVYKSKKQAKNSLDKICREYNLCPKQLSLESGKGPCFGSQIGICKGVCGGHENVSVYNTRFERAFESSRIKAWPYSGAICISEKQGGLAELHVIDNWLYLGSVRYDAEDDTHLVTKYSPRFDWDIYKIIVKAVFLGRNVMPVPPEVTSLFNLEPAGKRPSVNKQAKHRSHLYPF